MPLTVLYRPPEAELARAAHDRRPQPLAGAWSRRRTCAACACSTRRSPRGEAVGLLPDQAPGVGEGAWADFFGRPAYTMTLVRRLQQTSGAAVIMAFAERLPQGRGYRLHLEELSAGRLDEAALNRAIEAQVRRCPTQYLWSYNRYKVPAGAKPPAIGAEGGRR